MDCIYCGEWFSKDSRNYKKQKYCGNECRRKHWRKLNPEMEAAQQKRTREKRKTDPERYALWKLKGNARNKTPLGRYIHCRSGANSRKIPFLLTKEEFNTFVGKPCYYCGDKIEVVGIDRVDNSKGYEISNCVSCCLTCNIMKNTKTLDEFLHQCQKIVNKLYSSEEPSI